VLVVSTGDIVGLTRQVATQLLVSLPYDYRIQSGTLEAAEAELDRLAALNGWTAIE
jgi:ABC-type Fe3+ transport system permease subunit